MIATAKQLSFFESLLIVLSLSIKSILFSLHISLAIIKPGVDVFDPRVIRASMGALFNINFEYFDSFSEYLDKYPKRNIYSLMLKGAKNIHSIGPDEFSLHISLIILIPLF